MKTDSMISKKIGSNSATTSGVISISPNTALLREPAVPVMALAVLF